MVDKKLNWNAHITGNGIANKPNRMMGLMKLTLGYSAPTSVSCKQLYITPVRSTLEYCFPVWTNITLSRSTFGIRFTVFKLWAII